MKFKSQKIAYWFFASAMLLLVLQIIYGFIMGFARVGHDVLHDFIPFNTARAVHTNLLVVWLLLGFMGAAYFIIPEEADRELCWPKLAWVQLISFLVVGVIAVIGYHINWWEGRKFLEIPRPLDYLVVVNVLLFIANIGMTIWKGTRYTTTSIVLYFGLLAAALLYLPGMITLDNQTTDSFYRWWVVHLWVEGVWELIMGALLCYLLIKLTGVDREIVEKWLYIIVGLTFLSGILGTGHHYYYIGAPRYWLMVGGIFSALEPLAFLGMAIYALAMAKKGWPPPSQQVRAELDTRQRHHFVRRRRFPRSCAHATSSQHVDPRNSCDRHARPHGVLGGVRHDQSGNDCLRPAGHDRPQAVGQRLCGIRVLAEQHWHGGHDWRPRCRRHHPGESGTPHGTRLSRRAKGNRNALYRHDPRPRCCSWWASDSSSTTSSALDFRPMKPPPPMSGPRKLMTFPALRTATAQPTIANPRFPLHDERDPVFSIRRRLLR